MKRTFAGASAAIVLSLLTTTAAHAAGGSDVDAARHWFNRGLASAKAGDHAGARRAFAAAYALVPSVDILWNLAAAERRAGDDLAALRHLRVYVASGDARPDRRSIAEQETIPELEARVARIVVHEPEGSSVTIDGRDVGRAATEEVAPGVHAVVIRREGGERSLVVEAVAGASIEVPSAPSVTARPLAVAVAAPSSPSPASPPIDASAVASTSFETPSGAARGKTVTVLTFGAVALAALGTGAYFGISAQGEQSRADRLGAQMRSDDLSCKRSGSLCDDYDASRSAANRESFLATTLLATGGLLTGAAVVAWVLWPAAPARVVPSATKDAGGISVIGRF